MFINIRLNKYVMSNQKIKWVTTGFLGTVTLYSASEIGIKLEGVDDFNINYNLISGALPHGLSLLNDGTIAGYATTSSIIPSTGTSTSTFIAGVKQVGKNNFISSSTFNIEVKNSIPKSFCQLHLKPLLSVAQNNKWYNLLNNKEIFPAEFLYRPQDLNFGIQYNPICVLHHDLEFLNINQFGLILRNNFYKRRYTLSRPAIRIAKIGQNIQYEVVYCELLDYNRNVSKEFNFQTVLNQTFYPSSIKNMRGALESQTAGTNVSIRPLHFLTPQENIINSENYLPIVVLCYTLPNKSKNILNRLKTSDINFNEIDFEIDRIYIKSLITNQYQTIHLDQTPPIS